MAVESSSGPASQAATGEVRWARHSQAFRWLVRSGFAARAITYGVIGALALALASGAGTEGAAANQQGALALIARQDLGQVALVVIAVGLLAYALWKLSQGVLGRGAEGSRSPEWTDRVANIAGGVAYVVFFVVAVEVLTGSAGNSSSAPRHDAAGVLAWPGGPAIVGGGGAILVAVSLYQAYDAVRGKFAEDCKTERMGAHECRVFIAVGRVGLLARALVFVLVGYFLLKTAIEFHPGTAVGIDGALARLHQQPLGSWLVGLVGAGLLVFAVFSLFEARYRRL